MVVTIDWSLVFLADMGVFKQESPPNGCDLSINRSHRVSDSANTPYCDHCGYSLKGLTESSKCPECGKPLVEVLMRESFPGRRGYRYQSKKKILGWPLISIATGPFRDERVGRPVGIIAIGDYPKGVVAIGAICLGFVSIGGLPIGLVSLGGVSLGLLAVGGCALGVVAVGGVSIGVWAVGGTACYVLAGWGGSTIQIPFP